MSLAEITKKRQEMKSSADEPKVKKTATVKKTTLVELSMGDLVTFPKQRMAIEELQKARTIWKDDLRIFSYELKGGDGERRYLVTTLQRFWKWYSQQKERHIYELIYEDMPCRLYFDLEYSKEANIGIDHEVVYRHFTSVLAQLLQELFNISLDEDKDLLILESSTETKFSAHVICNFEGEYLFPSSSSIRHFSDILSKKLSENPPQKIVNADGKEVPLFDTAVYSRNRNFRIYLSAKMGKTAKLEYASYCKFYERRGIKKPSDGRIFLDSLCVPKNYHQCPVLDLKHLEPKENINNKDFPSKNSYNGAAKSGEGLSPFPQIDDFLTMVLQKWKPNVYFRQWKIIERDGKVTSIIYYPGNSRYCFNIEREHKSNGTFWTVDLEKRHFFQKCFDPDCRGTSSNYFPLPDFIKIDTLEEEDLETSKIELKELFTNWDSVFDF